MYFSIGRFSQLMRVAWCRNALARAEWFRNGLACNWWRRHDAVLDWHATDKGGVMLLWPSMRLTRAAWCCNGLACNWQGRCDAVTHLACYWQGRRDAVIILQIYVVKMMVVCENCEWNNHTDVTVLCLCRKFEPLSWMVKLSSYKLWVFVLNL